MFIVAIVHATNREPWLGRMNKPAQRCYESKGAT